MVPSSDDRRNAGARSLIARSLRAEPSAQQALPWLRVFWLRVSAAHRDAPRCGAPRIALLAALLSRCGALVPSFSAPALRGIVQG